MFVKRNSLNDGVAATVFLVTNFEVNMSDSIKKAKNFNPVIT